jgi:ComF family protein
MLKRLLQGRLALPSLCAVCRSWNTHAVCNSCLLQLGRVARRCPSCALPLAPGLNLCAHCTEHGHSPLAKACARLDYQWPWTHWVQQWKFQQHSAWSAEWARLLLQDPDIVDTLKNAQVWVPIPLTPERLAERGFNQSWELIKHLHLHVPDAQLLPHALRRNDTKRVQHQLTRIERLAHAQQALLLNPEVVAQVQGRSVLLVDDVMTTGATLYAATQHLKAAGAIQVCSVVLARTPQATTQLRPFSTHDEAMLLS